MAEVYTTWVHGGSREMRTNHLGTTLSSLPATPRLHTAVARKPHDESSQTEFR